VIGIASPARHSKEQAGRCDANKKPQILKGIPMPKNSRKKLSKGGSKRLFKATVNKMKKKNLPRPRRGGGRL
jgi:hypothetical protein